MDGFGNAGAVTGAFATSAASAGVTDGRASRQWASRPDDQRFTDLRALRAMVAKRTEVAGTRDVKPGAVRVLASHDSPDLLRVQAGGAEMAMDPNHWSFGQLCQVAEVPAAFLRRPDMPALLAGINLQFGLAAAPDREVRAYFGQDRMDLRAVTSTSYGRINDLDLVDQVIEIAGDGRGATRWKVPGVMAGLSHNPFVDVTRGNTTLYASDRDCFLFLVDDTHPISIGKLPNGDDDLVFRGFYAWNSEVGSETQGLATFLLRGVCCNRNIWGGQDFAELTLRHTKGAPGRFVEQVRPRLLGFTDGSASKIVAGVEAARAVSVGDTDDEVTAWLTEGRAQLSRKAAGRLLAVGLREEEHPVRNLWDVVQGLSAMARAVPFADERVALERRAGRLLATALA